MTHEEHLDRVFETHDMNEMLESILLCIENDETASTLDRATDHLTSLPAYTTRPDGRIAAK